MNDRDTDSVIGEFTRQLCSAGDYHSLLATVVSQTCRSLEAENAIVWIYDDQRGELCCEASRQSVLRLRRLKAKLLRSMFS